MYWFEPTQAAASPQEPPAAPHSPLQLGQWEYGRAGAGISGALDHGPGHSLEAFRAEGTLHRRRLKRPLLVCPEPRHLRTAPPAGRSGFGETVSPARPAAFQSWEKHTSAGLRVSIPVERSDGRVLGSVQGQHSDPVRSERLGPGAGRSPVTLTFPHTGCDAGPRWAAPGQRTSLLTGPALLPLPDTQEGSPCSKA